MVAKGPTTYREKPRRYRKHRRKRAEEEEYEEDKNHWNFAFCFFFTNQAGTVIMSFSGIALIITTMLVHWYAPSLSSSGVSAVQNLLLHAYLFVMLAGFIIAFISAYLEKGVLAKVAALLVLIGTVFYMIFFVMSFMTDSMIMLYVCPEMRCPDHHWLQDSAWRGYVVYSENIERYRNLEKEIKEIEEKINTALKKELATNEFNNSYRFLNKLSPKIDPEKHKNDKESSRLKNITDLKIQKHDKESQKENNGQYIRFLSPSNNTGSSILILVSIFYGLLIIAYFVYTIVTFFAFGQTLTSEHA